MDEFNLQHMTISFMAQQIREGKLNPLELTEHFLDRIDSLNTKLNAFQLACRERALIQAQAANVAIRAEQNLGPLFGIPYAVKDLFNVRGLPTTAGCTLLKKNIARKDATVIRRLNQAGMILLGKTNTVQLAYGGLGINHDHGTPHNPWHQIPYLPGGSSSGSAVAISAGMVPMALGTDTGGSVRIPASLCSIVGFKPSFGRISCAGVYPLSWSMDTVGPLVRSVGDAALIYQCVHGPDLRDETTLKLPQHDILSGLKDGVKGLRLRFAESVFWEDINIEVKKAVRQCGSVFEDLGAHVESIDFTEEEAARQLTPKGLIIAAEAYVSNKKLLDNHFSQLDPIIATRMIKGKEIRAAEYLQNSLDIKCLRFKVNHYLRDVDALLVPATYIPALPIAEVDKDLETYFEYNSAFLRNTSIGNILNLCAITVRADLRRKVYRLGS